MIKLVISDVDGTLLNVCNNDSNPKEDKPSEEVFEMIKNLQNKGIIFGVASGRQYGGVKKLFEKTLDGMVFCCENGSIIVKDDEIISKSVLDRRDFEGLFADIQSTYPETQALISSPSFSYMINPTEKFYHLIHDFLRNDTKVVDSIDEIQEDIIKVSIYRENIGEVADKYIEKWGKKFNLAVAGECWLDCTVTTKGEGITKLCKALSITTDEVVVFGDNYNDIPMFEVAGQSFAMEMSDENVKKYASGTCVSVPQKCRELFE